MKVVLNQFYAQDKTWLNIANLVLTLESFFPSFFVFDFSNKKTDKKVFLCVTLEPVLKLTL